MACLISRQHVCEALFAERVVVRRIPANQPVGDLFLKRAFEEHLC